MDCPKCRAPGMCVCDDPVVAPLPIDWSTHWPRLLEALEEAYPLLDMLAMNKASSPHPRARRDAHIYRDVAEKVAAAIAAAKGQPT